MEHDFAELPTCFTLSPSEAHPDLIAVGSIDGKLQMMKISGEAEEDGKASIESLWDRQQKRSIRALLFSSEGDQLYSLSMNRGLCSYDVETGKRTRVIKESHDGKPMTACRLPPNAWHGQTFSTADEEGQVRTWDWRSKDAIVMTYSEQEEAVNALAMDGTRLLSASSDGTLAVFEVRRKKLEVRSELMHSELMSICVTKKYTYVGAGDGSIEIFRRREYGNILERMESGFENSVSSLVELRRGLLLAGCDEDAALRLLHTEPNKRLGEAGKHGEGGVDHVESTVDGQWIVSMASFDQSLKVYPLPPILERVPMLRSVTAKTKKGEKVVAENFFDGLVKQPDGEDSDEEEEGEGGEADSDSNSDLEDESEVSEQDGEDEQGSDEEDEEGEEEVDGDGEIGEEEEGEESEEEEEEVEPVKPPAGKKRRLK